MHYVCSIDAINVYYVSFNNYNAFIYVFIFQTCFINVIYAVRISVDIWYEKARMTGARRERRRLIIFPAVLTELTSVTDRQTNGQTQWSYSRDDNFVADTGYM